MLLLLCVPPVQGVEQGRCASEERSLESFQNFGGRFLVQREIYVDLPMGHANQYLIEIDPIDSFPGAKTLASRAQTNSEEFERG